MIDNLLSDILKLSVADRLQLVEDIWDSIAGHRAAVPLTDDARSELNRRLDEQAADPGAGRPWSEVLADVPLQRAIQEGEASEVVSRDEVFRALDGRGRLIHFLQIEIEREEDGRWIAEVPNLPGVLAYGADRDSAVAKAQALASRVLAERVEHGEHAHLIARGRRGTRERYEEALAEVPDVEPNEERNDEITARLDRIYGTQASSLDADLHRAQRSSISAE